MSASFLVACLQRSLDGTQPSSSAASPATKHTDAPASILRCPLIQSSQTDRVKELIVRTSFSQLPWDVLNTMVPHLLRCRMSYNIAYPEHYYWAINAHQLLATRHKPIANVIERAWLPVLRTRLVCKSLHGAVSAFLDQLLQPRGTCTQAASKIPAICPFVWSWHNSYQPSPSDSGTDTKH
jgi:hypothetical protein